MIEAVAGALITPYSVTIFFVLGLIVAVTHQRMARVTGARRWPLLFAGFSLAGAIGVTMSPSGVGRGGRIWCGVGMPRNVGLLELPGFTTESLNALILLPFAFFATVAWRQWWIAAVAVLLIPVIIEFTQMLIPFLGRTCNTQDWFDNATGGLVGVLLGFGARVVINRISSANCPTRVH